MTDQQQSRAKLPPPRGGNGQRGETLEERAQRLFRQLRADLNNKEFRTRIAGMCLPEFRTVSYVDRLCESIFVACRDNPKLLTECDRASLFRAAERVAKRGLTVGDNVAWLVPFKGQVQDQLGYKGCMILVRRAVPEANFSTQAVYEHDVCDIVLGDTPKVEHRINLRSSRGSIIGAYAIVKIKEWVDVEPIDVEEVNFVRSLSPGKDSPAWNNWYSEMARKIPLKRLCKRLPTERTIDLADMDDRGGELIEGVAEMSNWDAPALTHSDEAPINTTTGEVGGEDKREKVPVDRDQRAEDEDREYRAERAGEDPKKAEPQQDEPRAAQRKKKNPASGGGMFDDEG